eukprot:s9739_g1.t1
MVPSTMIAVMHELLVALSSTMKRYYDKATMGIVMVQALKFCAAASVGRSCRCGQETTDAGKKAAKDVSVKSQVFAELRAKLHENEQLQTDPADEAATRDELDEDVEMTVKSQVFAELRAKLHENEQLQTDPADEAATRDELDEDVEMTDMDDEDPLDAQGVEIASGSGKKAMMKSLGSGYSEEEKFERFGQCVSDLYVLVSPKTALDDFLCAMRFVMDEIRHASEIAWTDQYSESQITDEPLESVIMEVSDNDMRQKEDVGLQGTLAFCTMMWLEFVWTQKVNVNGKQHRIYSSLRSELQSVMRAAHVKLTTTGHPSGMKTDAVDALSLGQMLVNQFAKAPVKSVVFNDEEDASVHRVAQAMATNYDGVVVPIQDYIKKGYPDAPAHARCLLPDDSGFMVTIMVTSEHG